eukprot:scaffold98_cov244-Pinguiococcus_pyrenoidosus.AAC.7
MSASTSPWSPFRQTCGFTMHSDMSPSLAAVEATPPWLLWNTSSAHLSVSSCESGANHPSSSAPGSLPAISIQSSKLPPTSGPQTCTAHTSPVGSGAPAATATLGESRRVCRSSTLKAEASRPLSTADRRSIPENTRSPLARLGARYSRVPSSK